MVKVLLLQDSIEFAEPQAVFSFLYGDDQFVKRYHKKVNDDPYVEVTNWTEDGFREVKFTALIEAPKLIKKIVEADSMSVKESQRYRKDGDRFIITSEAFPNIPGGDRFVTSGETILSPNGKGGCIVAANITLEFKAGVWGVQGAVESFMESQARTSFEGWIAIARHFCQERMGLAKETLPEEDQDEFFDLEELSIIDSITTLEEIEPAQESSDEILNILRSTHGRNGENLSGVQSWFIQTVLKELTVLQISNDASHSYMEKLNAKLLKMEEDLSFVRSHVAKPKGFIPEGSAWCLYGLGIATGLTLAFIFLKTRKQT